MNAIDAQHWVAGRWLAEGPRRESINPATGEVIGHFFDATVETAQAAIDAASQAFESGHWCSDGFLRATALCHLADAYESRLGEVIDILSTENGKLRGEAGFEASLIPRALRFAAGLAMHNFGRVLEARPGQHAMSLRVPAGVAGLIVPWNGPAYLFIRALAPALAAGCATVVKMPAEAAQIAALASKIVSSVSDIPSGIVNVFIESGAAGAKLLVDSPRVPVIHFTGSTATGRAVAMAGASQLKRVGLELGGKNPHLIFEDADLSAVLPVLEKSSTVFGGQFCMTGSKILVHSSKAGELKASLAERLKKVRPGPAADAGSHMGPMINKAAVARVDSMVEAAIAAGAKVIVRGGPALDGALVKGSFYRPTLLEVADPALKIVREEVFGPVQTIQLFDSEDEAVALANDSDYGLTACIWSRDVDRPIRIAKRLQAGLICINNWANIAVEFEEGGFKKSGQGRLGGLASMEDFLEYKQITQDFNGGVR